MSSKLDLTAETIIRQYAKRWFIKTDFKTAVHEVGTFSYRYWMKSMNPTKRKTKQYLNRENEEYRPRVLKKLYSYHKHVAFGCISQGLMKHLAINYSEEVWASFKGWLRTIRRDQKPSEIVVSEALRSTIWNELGANRRTSEWEKFTYDRLDLERVDQAA